jgi:thiamine-monophosphate kinase
LIDVSDGVAADLGHICAESKLGAIIEEDKIPTTELFKEYCDRFKLDAIHLSLHVGEDYVLLGTVEEKLAARLEEALAAEGCEFYPIGTTVAEAGLKLKFQDGSIETIGASGWDHFR